MNWPNRKKISLPSHTGNQNNQSRQPGAGRATEEAMRIISAGREKTTALRGEQSRGGGHFLLRLAAVAAGGCN